MRRPWLTWGGGGGAVIPKLKKKRQAFRPVFCLVVNV